MIIWSIKDKLNDLII